jgi:hypothetical protein
LVVVQRDQKPTDRLLREALAALLMLTAVSLATVIYMELQ